MDPLTNLQIWVTVWAIATFALLFGLWKSKEPTAALPLAYALSLIMLHYFGGVIYALPWYSPTSLYLYYGGSDRATAAAGFQVSAIGFIGFVLGTLFLGPLLIAKAKPTTQKMLPSIRRSLPTTLMLMGVLFFTVIFPILSRIPSVGAVAVAGVSLTIVGVALAIWKAWLAEDKASLIKWLALTAMFPIVTLTMMGFIGFGVAAASVIWVFVASFYRPRWQVVTGFVLVLYFGLSVFATYFRDRESLRDVLWEEFESTPSFISSLQDRAERVFETFLDFELIDFTNQDHLESIDMRLNQNIFVGQAVSHIGNGAIEYGRGNTIMWAAISIIPRIVWPSKPKVAGGSEMVEMYTGRELSDSSTFGVGSVLEFYINFGTIGVFVGLAIMGGILRGLDIQAGRYLKNGDWWRFAAWFVVGLQLVQPGNNLAKVVTGTAAAAVLMIMLHQGYFSKFYLSPGPVSRKKGPAPRGNRRPAPPDPRPEVATLPPPPDKPSRPLRPSRGSGSPHPRRPGPKTA